MNHPGDEEHPLVFMDGSFGVSHKSFDDHPQQSQYVILNLRNWSLGRGAVGKGTVVEKWGRLVQYRLDREGTYGPAAGQFGFAKSSW